MKNVVLPAVIGLVAAAAPVLSPPAARADIHFYCRPGCWGAIAASTSAGQVAIRQNYRTRNQAEDADDRPQRLQRLTHQSAIQRTMVANVLRIRRPVDSGARSRACEGAVIAAPDPGCSWAATASRNASTSSLL